MSTFEDAIGQLLLKHAKKGKKYKPLPVKALEGAISETLTIKNMKTKKSKKMGAKKIKKASKKMY